MARPCSTICLPIGKDAYQDLIGDPKRFRDCPELFPEAFASGYTIKDGRTSAKTGLRLRRVRLKSTGEAFSVRPSFALPYMTALAGDVQGPLFLRCFGVPFWALARVFGRGPMYWYRLEVGLGRNSAAGTTLRRARLPAHLLADEHHQPRDGVKNYVATTVGAGCCLGAALAQTAGAEDLQAAYGAFKREAGGAQPGYRPRTVSVDGWAATRQAWQALFPLAVLPRCFLHGWLNIRSRGKLTASFAALSERAWAAFHAPSRRGFAQRLRRLWEWARVQELTAWVPEQVRKLCARSREYGLAYAHPGGHRTSNMLDRVMRAMSRYNGSGQHLHGSAEACGRHVRAWALLYNFRPWRPATARANGGWRCPAERLNKHRYHEDWLQNLLASASLGGYRRSINPPHNP
ncbi:MAG TPA: hypothetical protein VFO85_17260 [Vicinamibacteria bacterium]|nr:hypothetical protein [Vicinamibacteria bacterium]